MKNEKYTTQELKEVMTEFSTVIYNKINAENLHTKPSPDTIKYITEIKGEINSLRGDLFGETGIDKTLVRIEEQVVRTNGRVTELEKKQVNTDTLFLSNDKFIKIAMKISSYFIGTIAVMVVGIFIYWTNQISRIQNDIQSIKQNPVIVSGIKSFKDQTKGQTIGIIEEEE